MSSVQLPSLNDILNDLSILHDSTISLSQPLDIADMLVSDDKAEKSKGLSGLDKLEKFKASTGKSHQEEGVVESGFEVSSDFIKMQQQLSTSKREMGTLQDRMGRLEKELIEVRELIAYNPIE